MEETLRDLGYAFRRLVRTPLVSVAILSSLALGIGANTAIFSLIHAVFLRPPAVSDPERVVQIFFVEKDKESHNLMSFSRLNYLDLERAGGEPFEALCNVINVPANYRIGQGDPEQTFGQMVTGSYFDLFGVGVVEGRGLQASDDVTPGAHPVVVLSHHFWSNRFGADPSVVGSTLSLNGRPFTVVGVAEEGFNGTAVLGSPSFWVPMMMYDTMLTGTFRQWYDERRAGLTNAFGRLRDDIALAQAEEAVSLFGRSLEEEHPVDNRGRTFTLVPLAEATLNPAQRELFVRAGWMLMAAVGLVLLVACANVANLLLGQAAVRRQEIGIRLALGARRWRLIHQLLTESLLLGLLAGGLGLLLASWLRSLLWALRPPFLENSPLDLSFDLPVLAFTLSLSLITGLLFGLIPAVQATRPRLVEDLKDLGGSGGGRRVRLNEILVAAQVALAFVSLIGSGLFLRSLGEATRIDLGFEPEGLVAINLNPGSNGYEAPQGEAYFDRALEEAASIPGVESVALSTVVPLVAGDLMRTVLVEGRSREEERNAVLTAVATVSLDFFETMGLQLRSGQLFGPEDHADSRPVVVVNQAMADFFWPGVDPIGQRFQFFGQEVFREVVGVVATTKLTSLGEDPQPLAYMPRRQNYRAAMTLVARGRGDAEALLGTLRRSLQAIEPDLALTGVQTVSAGVLQSLWPARTTAVLLGLLGLLALCLSAVGIYGVMSHLVAERRRELSIRLALGAQGRRLLFEVLRRGMTVTAAGLAVGVTAALLLSRGISRLLYGVSPSDPSTYLAILLLLAAVAVLANLLPARKAMSVDPVRVLRAER